MQLEAPVCLEAWMEAASLRSYVQSQTGRKWEGI